VSKTSTQAKDKYNEAHYARYTFRVRIDDTLYEDIEEFKNQKGTSLNFLMEKLLREHFLLEN
jgi:predicted HicB family RNase H-like nuclease